MTSRAKVWLYRCNYNNDEWHKEEPVKVVFSLNYKQDGSLPAAYLTLQDWLRSKQPARIVIPIHYPEFQTHNEPIQLELAACEGVGPEKVIDIFRPVC